MPPVKIATCPRGAVAQMESPFYSAAMLLGYLRNLNRGRIILWCYLVWYLVVLVRYFDPNPRLWITSLGLSAIIGIALYLSATAGATKARLDRWTIFRLFLMPFCVSSFAALVKGRNFILVFSPNAFENVAAIALCALFCGLVWVVKKVSPAKASSLTAASASAPKSAAAK